MILELAVPWLLHSREGANVVINYLPAEESDAQEVAAVINSTTEARIFTIAGDLRNEFFCTDLVNRSVELLGGLDILVNNAGFGSVISLDIATHSSALFNQTIETNVDAPFWLSRAARPHLPPGSSIIFTASAMVMRPNAALIDYAASKGFINTFSQALSFQLAPAGIRVNSVAPGLTLTPFLAAQGLNDSVLQMQAAAAPYGRVG